MDYAVIRRFLSLNLLVLRHQSLHNAPRNQVSQTAEAEHNEVATLLAAETEEAECLSELKQKKEKHSCTLLDEE